jgi:hypothetical protein
VRPVLRAVSSRGSAFKRFLLAPEAVKVFHSPHVNTACLQCGLTPPSSGQTTAGKVVLLCEHRARRCLPLMSNVMRHSKQCPSCGGRSIERRSGTLGLLSPPFVCKTCGAPLKLTVTRSSFWAVPASMASVGVLWLAISWLNSAPTITGAARVGIIGGLGGLAMSLPMQVLMRSMRYREWGDKQSRGAR